MPTNQEDYMACVKCFRHNIGRTLDKAFVIVKTKTISKAQDTLTMENKL